MSPTVTTSSEANGTVSSISRRVTLFVGVFTVAKILYAGPYAVEDNLASVCLSQPITLAMFPPVTCIESPKARDLVAGPGMTFSPCL
jgi:hypothetical protein